MGFVQIDTLSVADLAEGIKIRLVPAERMTMVFFYIKAGARVPEHTHPHEQMGMVLKGSLLLKIGDMERMVLPGTVYRVPSNVVHGGRCLEDDAEIMEVFSPPRIDLLEKVAGIISS